MKRSKYNKEITIIDLLFNVTTKLLLVFVALFVLTALLIHPKTDKHVQPKAEYIITMTWPDGNQDDIDLWVSDPAGDIVWYGNKDTPLVTLERDNRGQINNKIQYEGQEIANPERTETVTVRGVISGIWIVNVQFYEQFDDGHVPVIVRMVKLNPYKEIFSKKVYLERAEDEKTIYSFRMLPDGSITDFSEDFISLLDLNRKASDN